MRRRTGILIVVLTLDAAILPGISYWSWSQAPNTPATRNAPIEIVRHSTSAAELDRVKSDQPVPANHSKPEVIVTESIQAAIVQARAGDTIVVPAGAIFREHITIDKSVSLVGRGNPIIDGGGAGTVISIQAPDVHVSGLRIHNSGADLTQYDAGVRVEGNGAHISDCEIRSGGFGIFVRGVNHCSISGNDIRGPESIAVAKRGNGIHLWKTKRNQILDNHIQIKRDGIYFSFADETLVQRNQIEECRFGIHYMYSHQNRLFDNALTRNAVGATLMFARGCQIESNRVWANRRHGILLKQVEGSTFRRNFIAGQNRGFFIQQAAQDRFEENMIFQNDIGVYLSNCSEQNIFTGNAFVRNADQVWQPPDEVALGRLASNVFYEKGRGNFWSDYAGHDAQGDGIGDTPYHETDVLGYLIDRNPEARLFALSPAVALMRKGEELVPLMDVTGVTDLFPLIEPSAAAKRAGSSRLGNAVSLRSTTLSAAGKPASFRAP